MSFQVKIVLAFAGLIGLAMAILLLFSGGDEKAIRDLIESGAEAAERRDPEAVVALISTEYNDGRRSYAAVCERIRAVLSDRVGQIEVTGAAIQIDGDRAEASVRVKSHAGPHVFGEFGLRLKLVREGEGWKVVSAEELDR